MTDTRASSPRDVLGKLLHDVSADQWDNLHELYSEDTVVRHPFARDGSILLEGREALRVHFEHFAHSGLKLRARDVVYHDTTDPEVAIAEFVYDGIGPGADEHFEMAACFVWRVRKGLIIDCHDYLDRFRPVEARQS